MELDSALYRTYLEELQALERFRITYSGLHPEVGLERDDPDVRRLVEAMAVLTARSRLAGRKAVARTANRLFTQQLPYLLSPVPALALIQALPQAGFEEVDVIEEGEAMMVRGVPKLEGGRLRPPREALYRTLRRLQVLPIEIESVRSMRREDGGRNLYLDLRSRHPRSWSFAILPLLIDHLSELQSSATVFSALRSNLIRTTIAYGRKLQDGAGDVVCKTTFGRPAGSRPGHDLVDHPLQRARMFFRLPQQYMFMNVEVPPNEGEWQQVTLCLELGSKWPRGLAPTRDSFKLNAVPVVNLSRELTDPVDCDGTKDRYPLLHSDPVGHFRPHSVAATYVMDPDEGLVPLPSAAVPLAPSEVAIGTYEIEYERHDTGRRAWAVLDLPNVFEEPVQATADVFWYQPELTADREPPEEIRPADRNLEGVTWKMIGDPLPPIDSPIENDDEALLDLLALKSQPALQRRGLLTVLHALRGSDTTFASVIDAITDVDVRALPYAHASAGIKQVYRVRLGTLDVALVPVLDLMGPRLREILHAWSTQEVVELEVSIPALEMTLTYATDGGET